MKQKRAKKPHVSRTRQRTSTDVQVRVARLVDLSPDGRNANDGTERGREMLESSVRKHGVGRPLLADKHGRLIAGNKTHEVLVGAGFEDVIVVETDGTRPIVHKRTDLDLEKDPAAAELAIADNRVAQVSLSWNAEVLEQLAADGVKLDGLWTEDELAALLSGRPRVGKTDPDEIPGPRPSGVHTGELFELGNHLLLCGDATVASDVARVVATRSPSLMVTTAPAAVDYASVWALFEGDVAYVYHQPFEGEAIRQSLEACSFGVRSQIIWRKPRFTLGRGHYGPQHEPAWYAIREGQNARWVGDRKQSTFWMVTPTVQRCSACGCIEVDVVPEGPESSVWDIEARPDNVDIGSPKPVECVARPMRNHASAVVYEPFAGVGTAIIAAEILSRTCLAIEREPTRVQQAIDRWEAFTGRRARKVGDAP